jgi:hypothetical protein
MSNGTYYDTDKPKTKIYHNSILTSLYCEESGIELPKIFFVRQRANFRYNIIGSSAVRRGK